MDTSTYEGRLRQDGGHLEPDPLGWRRYRTRAGTFGADTVAHAAFGLMAAGISTTELERAGILAR